MHPTWKDDDSQIEKVMERDNLVVAATDFAIRHGMFAPDLSDNYYSSTGDQASDREKELEAFLARKLFVFGRCEQCDRWGRGDSTLKYRSVRVNLPLTRAHE